MSKLINVCGRVDNLQGVTKTFEQVCYAKILSDMHGYTRIS